MAKQLLGKEVTAALNEKIKANVAELQAKGVDPTLCIIRVGENPSDISYERGATKRCETLGVACEKILLPEDVSQDELLATIDKVNKDDKIHGVLLFRPLPKHLQAFRTPERLQVPSSVNKNYFGICTYINDQSFITALFSLQLQPHALQEQKL